MLCPEQAQFWVGRISAMSRKKRILRRRDLGEGHGKLRKSTGNRKLAPGKPQKMYHEFLPELQFTESLRTETIQVLITRAPTSLLLP